MPSIQRRPGLPCVYPDTSTLVYAMAGAMLGADKGDHAIFLALVRASQDANLCLSFPHLLEFARGGKRAIEDGAFIDTLNTVWLVELERAERLELRNLLLNGRDGAPPAVPSVSSFLAQFETIKPETVPVLLRQSTVREFLRASTSDVAHLARLEGFASMGKEASLRLFVDRQTAAADGVTPEQFKAGLDQKTKLHLVGLAGPVHDELIAQQHPQYARPVGSTFGFPDRASISTLLPLPDEAPRMLPSFFTAQRVIRGAGAMAARKKSVTGKYFQNRGGDVFDWSHMVGAAYAEGFCCDQRTAEQLGDAREILGLPPPIVLKDNDKQHLAAQIVAVVEGRGNEGRDMRPHRPRPPSPDALAP